MDWFERLTGFAKPPRPRRARSWSSPGAPSAPASTARPRKSASSNSSLQTLRGRVAAGAGPAGALTLRDVAGDVRIMHRAPEYAGALFQVASQFNMLEMVGPGVTPEDGVGRYERDHTQGPACAIAAGAATIWRNYFAPVGGGLGQTRDRQLDGLADVGAARAGALGRPVESLWAMRNGYCLATREGLEAIGAHLEALDEAGRDGLRGLFRIGVHSDVEVTDGAGPDRPTVSQAFCSALPVAYSGLGAALWAPFARLVLEAAYEATLWAGVLNARRGASPVVLLTRVGGGAFGNAGALDRWGHGPGAGAGAGVWAGCAGGELGA